MEDLVTRIHQIYDGNSITMEGKNDIYYFICLSHLYSQLKSKIPPLMYRISTYKTSSPRLPTWS